jgi:NADH-quinone oxidoreductase subunit A
LFGESGTSLLKTYIPVLIMVVLAGAFSVVAIAGSWLLGPKRRGKDVKYIPYECGITPVGSAHERFPVKFYLVAMLFIVFDIEAVFLYPWAVVYRKFSSTAFVLIEMAVFIAVLLIGYLYMLCKRVLEWD